VIKTITGLSSPVSVAGSPITNRVYVANFANNTVTVIETVNNTVVGTPIQIPVQDGFDPDFGSWMNFVTDVAASPDGSRVYVTATDGNMFVINTTNNNQVSTFATGWYRDINVSPNGSRLYGTAGTGINIIDTSTMQSLGGVNVGPVWDLDSTRSEFTNDTYNLAVSPDGNRVYVTYGVTQVERNVGGFPNGEFITDSRGVSWHVYGRYNAVSVIDTNPTSATYKQEIARITVGAGAQDIALNTDGTRAYITSWDGKTVTVINTATSPLTAIGIFTTDQTSASPREFILISEPVFLFTRFITVGANGVLYVTDYTNNALYTVTVGNPQM
jgi:YVTN family beta-propeller protein